MHALLAPLIDWYLASLDHGGYWLIAALMALESTLVPVPSEFVIPPAAYLAHTQGHLSLAGVVLAGTAGSWVGATLMYLVARGLGRPLVLKIGPYVALSARQITLAEGFSAHYGWAGVFFARLLPVIRHLIGIPAGILRLDYRGYAAATLAGSLLWCTVLAWLGKTAGDHPALIAGSLRRFALLVLLAGVILAAVYYVFVHRPARRPRS